MNFTTYLRENAKFELDEKRSLNASIWKKDALVSDVHDALMKIADAFIAFVNTPDLKVKDILLTGSLANFTWHSKSDIDLHILVELPEGSNKKDLVELFGAKKALWNAEHNISVKGFPVELYVQPTTEKHASSGVYSIKKLKWITQPRKSHPSIDDSYVISKANKWKTRIDDLITHTSDNTKTIEAFKKRLREIRQMALDRDGEFAVENLAFKILRNDGYIKKLYDYSKELTDKQLSLK